jgi:hypothetical protein
MKVNANAHGEEHGQVPLHASASRLTLVEVLRVVMPCMLASGGNDTLMKARWRDMMGPVEGRGCGGAGV